VEQILQESVASNRRAHLTELEGKVSDLKHQVVEELYKFAEWYEKKAQTQIQIRQTALLSSPEINFERRRGEVSSVFASELDHSSRNFVGHTQTQMEEVVPRIIRTRPGHFLPRRQTHRRGFYGRGSARGRQELDGFGGELHRSRKRRGPR